MVIKEKTTLSIQSSIFLKKPGANPIQSPASDEVYLLLNHNFFSCCNSSSWATNIRTRCFRQKKETFALQ